MLFNSLEFIFVFLPATLLAASVLKRSAGVKGELVALLGASIAFYAYGNGAQTFILIASIVANYLIGRAIGRADRKRGRVLMLGGVAANIGALVYFKYWGFLTSQAASMGLGVTPADVLLPTGISFYTFLQVAYLVDAYTKGRPTNDFVDYAVFVTFFPHLIAGPILHHAEMMPQFYKRFSRTVRNFAAGTTIFAIGLAKKIFLADNMALLASPVFDGAAANPPDFQNAWLAAICYALQIYFDFSAYSDMAIGVSRLFGIRLPYNFASPYKATSIIEFWRRWHITLSRFLRDYVYVPLGGNRRGRMRTRINVFLTMIIGGAWHGAGWNFIIWGAMHGALLVGNHWFRERFPRARVPVSVGWSATFVAVLVAWVPFRANSVEACLAIWAGMAGLNGGAQVFLVNESVAFFWMPIALAIALLAPNSQQLMRRAAVGLRTPGYPSPFFVRGLWPEFPRLAWTPKPAAAVLVGLLLAASVLSLKNVTEFIYFRF